MRDYAQKQSFNGKRPSSKKTARKETAPAWGWTILGIGLGLGIAVLVAIKLFPKLVGINRTLATASELEQEESIGASPTAVQSLKTSEAKTPPKPKFDFYTLLPNMEELDIKESAASKIEQNEKIISTQTTYKHSANTVSAKDSDSSSEKKLTSYILQAGVFQSKQPAEALRSQLTLQGFDVNIEPYQKSDSSTTTWYRVYLGPFKQEAQAKVAQVSLQESAQVASFVIKSKA